MNILTILLSSLLLLASCASDEKTEPETTETETVMTTSEEARIVSVIFSGDADNYTFSVGIASPDTGCDQYANWWEVITEDGTLIYRRILGHSHVTEQPFVRSGGGVLISENQIVIIRAHMNTSGYGTAVYKGSIANGFGEATVAADFATALASQDPLPTNCAF